MPGYKCSIKDRMLYSTCKGPLLDVAASLGLEIEKKIETSDPKELNEEFLHDQLHPRKDLIRQKFAKPPKPSGSRGPRRIHKETSSTE